MDLSYIDLTVFLVYMVGIALLGGSFYKKNRTADDYTAGGGKLPSWVVGMSIFATFVSSISFLALPGKAYQSNWNAFVFSLSIPIASVAAVKFFVPLYRSLGSVSAYAYLETRFGPWARLYASLCYILTQIMRTGSILYLLALPLKALFGWDIGLIIIVTGFCVVIYSMLGGIKAVIWTDAIQGIILIGGALISALVLTFSMPEGPEQLFQIGMEYDKFSLGSFGASLAESTFWVMLLYGLFINLQNYGIDQNYVQRYMTTKTDKEAKASALFGSLLYVPVSLLFFYIGTALFAFYQASPDLLPRNLQSLDAADQVFPYFIVHQLPTGLTGLLIASIFAAGMSTVSTSVNSSATIILTDYYKRFVNPSAPEKKSMRVLYVSSLVFGIFGVGVGMAMISVKSALDAWWNLASIFSGGMLGLFLLGYIAPRAKNVNAAIGTVAGVLAIMWLSLSPIYFPAEDGYRFTNPFNPNLTIVIGTTVIFLTGFLLSVHIGKKKTEKEREVAR